MAIQKLPEYIINRLKAGEVVERPASALKELVENSLDAGATDIEIHIKNWWKSYLSVKDNGTGIELSDMDLLLERYATSKIQDDKDLQNISSYGFRGEALASISEISKISIISKTKYAQIASKLQKRGPEIAIQHLPANFEHGTEVIIEDLFFNTPARLKFLKSAQTEYYYCYQFFVDLGLMHFDKSFKLFKDDKLIFDLKAQDSIIPRITEIFKKNWEQQLIPIMYSNENIQLTGVVGDPSLRFGSGENIKIFVNSRPVQDKVIRRAIMDSFRRQITPGEFPFAIVFIETTGTFVDVNVHPRKMEVKFIDGQQVYQAVNSTIKTAFQENKIAHSPEHEFKYQQYQNIPKPNITQENIFASTSQLSNTNNPFITAQHTASSWNTSSYEKWNLSWISTFDSQHFNTENTQKIYENNQLGQYQIIGQLWNSYIVVQSNDSLYYVDQHALAERIAFEKMKKMYSTEVPSLTPHPSPLLEGEGTKGESLSPANKVSEQGERSREWGVNQNDTATPKWLQPEPLLNPIKYEISDIPNKEQKIQELNTLGFDCALISENMLVVYAIPKIFILHPIDLETVFNQVLYLDTIKFDTLLDEIYATKACKTSIKAWHKLGFEQMTQLIKDGFEHIEGLFVCQHGRPFFIQVEKSSIDKLFNR